MKRSQSLKVLVAGVVLSTGILATLPTAESALAASQTSASMEKNEAVKKALAKKKQQKPPVTKPSEIKTFEDLKQAAKALYMSPEFAPKEVVFNTTTDMKEQFTNYYFFSNDITEDIPGYTFYGRLVRMETEEVKPGVYKNTLFIVNDRDEQDEIAWNKKMDAAEKYIVSNYKLENEYDVVFAINQFIADNIQYGAEIAEDHPYLEWRPNDTTCTGYADVAATLYARFGIESRTVSGNSKQAAHAWNVVKLGGNWYHADSQYYGYGHGMKRNTKYLKLTESERRNTAITQDTNFKATDVQFDMSMAKPYSYQEVKKAQAKKK